jgi:hypothetical protein
MSPSQRPRRKRLLIATFIAAIAVILTVILVPFALGMVFTSTIITMTGKGCGPTTSPDSFNLPYEEVTFRATESNRDVHAYFIPGTNDVTILVPPTGNIGNGNLMHEISVLNANGYAALVYESRGCHGYEVHSLGYAEVAEVRDALDYLATRADVSMDKLGVHGFSTAGATAIFSAARFPELKTVVAEGNYHDFAEHLAETANGWYGAFYLLGAKLNYRLITGLDMAVLSPISVIGQIAPRPILLIYGTGEPALYGGRLELAAAGPNAELWEVEGAGHGGYWHVGAEEFAQRVVGFYNRAFGIAP